MDSMTQSQAATPRHGGIRHTDRFSVYVDQWYDGCERRGPATLKVVAGRLVSVADGDHAEALAAIGWTVERGAFLMPRPGRAALRPGADFDAVLLDGSPFEQPGAPARRAWSRGVETSVDALVERA